MVALDPSSEGRPFGPVFLKESTYSGLVGILMVVKGASIPYLLGPFGAFRDSSQVSWLASYVHIATGYEWVVALMVKIAGIADFRLQDAFVRLLSVGIPMADADR